MKFFLYLFVCLSICILNAKELKNPVVIFPENASYAEKNAAFELRNHLGAVLGHSVKAYTEKNAPESAELIFVGKTSFAAANKIAFAELGEEEYVIKNINGKIIILGGSDRGTLYGVLGFLERFADIDWLDAWTRYIPRKKSITVADELDIRFAPYFKIRGIFVNRLSDTELRIQFRSRSGDNTYWQEKLPARITARWGITPAYGSPDFVHTLYHYTKSWSKDMDDALSKDANDELVRSINQAGPGQICFSNQKAREKIVSQLKGFIEADRKKYGKDAPELYCMSLNDTKNFCHCNECMSKAKKYKAYSGTVLEYLNYVAREIKKDYPQIKLQLIAYLFTEIAPEGIKPEDNIEIQIALSPWSSTPVKTMHRFSDPVNSKSLENFKNWSKIAKNLHVWNYWILFDSSMTANAGICNVPIIADNIKFIAKNNVSVVFSELERIETVTFHPLRYFVGSKLMVNPELKLEDLLNRFFRGYYRQAALPMRQFYDYLIKRQAEQKNMEVPDVSGRTYLDREFFIKAEEFFTAAEKAVKNDKNILFNIIRERVPIDLARMQRRDLGDFDNAPKRSEVAARLRKNFELVVNRYYTPANRKNRIKAFETFIRSNTAEDKKFGLKYPLNDDRFKGKNIFDITFPDFNSFRHVAKYGVHIADDPEAVGGKALAVLTNPSVPDKKLHSQRTRMGIYRNGEHAFQAYFPRPATEKYELIKVCTIELTSSTLLWMHNSWILQQKIGSYYRVGKNNRFDIYVSMKRQGPFYIKNSTKPSGIFIDRILLVENTDKAK